MTHLARMPPITSRTPAARAIHGGPPVSGRTLTGGFTAGLDPIMDTCTTATSAIGSDTKGTGARVDRPRLRASQPPVHPSPRRACGAGLQVAGEQLDADSLLNCR